MGVVAPRAPLLKFLEITTGSIPCVERLHKAFQIYPYLLKLFFVNLLVYVCSHCVTPPTFSRESSQGPSLYRRGVADVSSNNQTSSEDKLKSTDAK